MASNQQGAEKLKLNPGGKGDCVGPWENWVTFVSLVTVETVNTQGSVEGTIVTFCDLKEQPHHWALLRGDETHLHFCIFALGNQEKKWKYSTHSLFGTPVPWSAPFLVPRTQIPASQVLIFKSLPSSRRDRWPNRLLCPKETPWAAHGLTLFQEVGTPQ